MAQSIVSCPKYSEGLAVVELNIKLVHFVLRFDACSSEVKINGKVLTPLKCLCGTFLADQKSLCVILSVSGQCEASMHKLQ